MKTLFEIEFNKDKFVDSVTDTIKSLDSLETVMQETTEQAGKINFAKSISNTIKFKESIEDIMVSMQKESGQTKKEIDKAVNEMLKSKSKITGFLNGLKEQIKKSTDKTEFNALSNQIKITENALAELSGETIKNENVNKSAKARLREMRNELLAMEDAGQDDTEMFRKLTIESAKLTDQIGDQSEKIRVLSSDTYKLDAGVDVVKQMANTWQLAEGALALFGVENEDVQKSIQKLVAIQAVANGLQEISTFVTGQSAGMVALKSGYNKTLALTEEAVALATGASTVATKAFSKALITTGIGAFIVALGYLVANWQEVTDAISGTNDITRTYADSTKTVEDALSGFIYKQKEMTKTIDLAKKGFGDKKEALKQYNEQFGETLGYAKNLNEAEKQLEENTPLYIDALRKRTLAQEFYKISAENTAKALVENEASTTQTIKSTFKSLSGLQKLGILVSPFASLSSLSEEEIDRFKASQQDYIEENKKGYKQTAETLNKEADRLLEESLIAQSKLDANKINKTDPFKKEKEKKVIENIYKELLAGFQSDLQKINEADLKGLDKINAEAENNYKERIIKINEALRDGKITKPQAQDLRYRVGLIKDAELQKEIKDFNDAKRKALQEAEKDEQSLRNELNQNRLDNLQDSYEKEVLLIEQQEKLRLQGIEDARLSGIDKIKELQEQGYLSEEQASQRIVSLNLAYDKIVKENNYKTNQELQKANTKRLENLREAYQRELDLFVEKNNVLEAEEVKAITERFNKGTISEEKYNNELIKIKAKYDNLDKSQKQKALREQISTLQDEINATTDAKEKELKIIQKYKLEAELLASETTKKESKTLLETIFGDKKKAEAVQGLLQETFNVATNLLKEQARLETEGYERAIAIQQDRVSEAQKIADAGNAEYLQQEQDRLNELEVKREQSARRQLEIDSAIQASQILVAVAGAAAQIAKGGTAEVIAGITTIVTAIGSGITLVNQMRDARPTFFGGTEGTVAEALGKPQRQGRDGYDISVDGSEMILNGNITSQLRKKGIKASDLPQIAEAGLIKGTYISIDKNLLQKDNNSLEKRLANLEVLQAENNEYLKKLSINVNLDSEGFATSITTMIDNNRKIRNA